MTTVRKRRVLCLAFAVATIALGLAWRFAPLGLPPFAYKYGGSALWAMMVYWLLAAGLPRVATMRLAVFACAVAALVECSRLHHSPVEDHFRATLAGRILLGRFFAYANIVAYWVAIAAAACIDRWLRASREDS